MGHGGVSGSARPVEHARQARDLGSNPAWRPSLKSQTAVLTTERYFTFSMVCLIVECTRRQHKGN